jgi:hypothetical protein
MYKGPGNGQILWHDLSTGKWTRFGTWNVRSLYRAGSVKTVARELGKYKLDLVGVQEVPLMNRRLVCDVPFLLHEQDQHSLQHYCFKTSRETF